MVRSISLPLLIGVLVFYLVGCAEMAEPDLPALENPEIILATTTSTQDSGLLEVLIPDFEEKSGYPVKTVAVGTGKALAMGKEGNADVLLVHAPDSEVEFMGGGYGSDRFLVMHNDFVIVGPPGDPAGIKGLTSATAAITKIASSTAFFASRGDDSGTHKTELSLWEKAGVTPQGDRYIETGQGMGPTLTIASEKGAYTLTDRATYLANQDVIDLEILLEGDPNLLNVYHVIVVNPQKLPKINHAGALAFAQYLVSTDTQKLIGEFGVGEYGQPLFFPDAGKTESDLDLK